MQTNDVPAYFEMKMSVPEFEVMLKRQFDTLYREGQTVPPAFSGTAKVVRALKPMCNRRVHSFFPEQYDLRPLNSSRPRRLHRSWCADRKYFP